MHVKATNLLFKGRANLLISSLYISKLPPVTSTGGTALPQGNHYQQLNRLYSAKMEAIRFIAIASIVRGHTLFGWDKQIFTTTEGRLVQVIFIALGRVGTINFFIISGYFLSTRIQKLNSITYLRYRLLTIIIPWLFFVCLFVLLQLTETYNRGNILLQLAGLFAASVFHAAYWFVPVTIVSGLFLVATKKYIHYTWYGLALFGVTLFYCINLHYGWASTNHAKSIFGYTFFMWLGITIRHNLQLFDRVVNSVRWRVLFLAAFAAFVFSCREGMHLNAIGCTDAYASIRFSNIILSVILFIIMLKTRSIYRVKKLKPKKYVYGVYLIHSILVLQLLPIVSTLVGKQHLFNYLPLVIIIQALFFIVVLVASYLFSVAIKKSKLRFITGG